MSDRYASLKDVTAAIIDATNQVCETEPVDVANLFTGNHENRIGTNGQFFSPGVFAFAYSLCDSINVWPNLNKWARDRKFTNEMFRACLNDLTQQNINYQEYNKFNELAALAKALLAMVAKTDNRDEIIAAVSAFTGYYNMFHQWVNHAFFWHVGKYPEFQYQNLAEAKPVDQDLSRRVHIENGRKIQLSYIKIKRDGSAENLRTLKAMFASNENPDLTQEWVDHLEKHGKMAVLMCSAMVSGGSTYGWSRIVSTAPIQRKERQSDAPIGRIRFSPLTGNKIILQDGPVTEAILTAVLGEVLPESQGDLEIIRDAVRDNSFAEPNDKAQIWAIISLA